MFEFFRKKHLHKKIQSIEKSLHYSFSKIKDDFQATHKKVDDHHLHTSKRLDELHNRIQSLEKLFSSYLSQSKKEEIGEEIENPHRLISLTDAQLKLLMEIIGIHLESGLEWVSLIELAKQIYPDKDYGTIRSTLSEYTSLLEEYGLIQKKIQRKKAYVKVTSQASNYLDENRARRLKKVIKKQKVN